MLIFLRKARILIFFFICIQTLCMPEAKALASLYICGDSPKHSLLEKETELEFHVLVHFIPACIYD